MNIKLNKIVMRNFKGVKSLTVDADCDVKQIYGDNATGKTSVFDAWTWLRTGKDSISSPNFSPKVYETTGEQAHHLEHEVTAELVIDGKTVTLTRRLIEKYEAPKGSMVKKFSGHTTEYEINGVPQNETEFAKYLDSICDGKTLALLSDPNYFSTQLTWQERRRILVSASGDVTDADVIASDEKLEGVAALLEGRKPEEVLAIETARKKKIKEQVEGIPQRIDEVSRLLASDAPEAPNVEPLKKRLQELQERKASLSVEGEIAELNLQIRKLEAKQIEAKNEATAGVNKGRDVALRASRALEADRATVANQRYQLDSELKIDREARQKLDSAIAEKRAALAAEKLAVYNPPTVVDTCPACGQSLPSDEVEAAKTKAREAWNLAHATKLEIISSEGKEMVALAEKLAAKIERKEATFASLGTDIQKLDLEIRKASDALADLVGISQAENPKLTAEIAGLRAKIEGLKEGNQDAFFQVDSDIQEVQSQINKAEKELAEIENRKTFEARLVELEADHQRLMIALEVAEKNLFLLDLFSRAKSKLLTEKINSKFITARWKLFEDYIAGGSKECCEVTVNGVPYNSLNHGSRINVGLEIINVLSEFYGVSAPIFIDNAESVTKITPTTGQQIQLIVDALSTKLCEFKLLPMQPSVTAIWGEDAEKYRLLKNSAGRYYGRIAPCTETDAERDAIEVFLSSSEADMLEVLSQGHKK